jgi:hypothetical protein
MRRTLLLVLLACLAVSLVLVAYPLYVIRPFRAQGPRELALALRLARYGPALALISAAVALAAFAGYWRSQRRTRPRVLAAVCAGLVCLLAALARVNVYELMFHPMGRPSFTAAAQVKLDKDEKVIAVKLGGSARAYTIRSLAYHHIANDVLGRTAIVATY